MKAFSPGHVTCFFQPVRDPDVLRTGSKGAGIKLSLGTNVTVEENIHGTNVTMDGKPSEAHITRKVLEILASDRNFDVTIENQLPVSQGLGMSAAGALAAALCVSEIIGKDSNAAIKAAHIAEIEGKGGLGDVSGLVGEGYFPFRTAAGLPPDGNVVGTGKRIKITIAVLSGKLETKNVLEDKMKMSMISLAGRIAVEAYQKDRSIDSLFSVSREFSKATGLESRDISFALSMLDEQAGMCMLGNSIFTTASADVVNDVLAHAEIYETESTDSIPKIIHKA